MKYIFDNRHPWWNFPPERPAPRQHISNSAVWRQWGSNIADITPPNCWHHTTEWELRLSQTWHGTVTTQGDADATTTETGCPLGTQKHLDLDEINTSDYIYDYSHRSLIWLDYTINWRIETYSILAWNPSLSTFAKNLTLTFCTK